ncbi:MAG: ABC transporter ATP-binding protein [Tetrasphaera jenkinsii]|jgi:ABC-2 type transport system ATP-binding protein|nr:ABC transporter ATP-binding protein [Tetrasphaera jenkinsii]MCI1262598.1 ABC transporter ATP-binding protein [Tetrasphaera jenkinsii]
MTITAPTTAVRVTAPAESGRTPAVVANQVTKSYGAVRALDGIDLTISRGEFFGILGPNGAGKTTLMEIIEGLRSADSGQVAVLGRSPWPRDLQLLGSLGVQTQASSFFPSLTALEHITTVATLYGVSAQKAAHTLDRFGLWDKKDVTVEKLSGGQQRRLAIAAAVTHDPEVIFLDEPTAALDPQARRELWSLLDELRAEGRTILYTTHYLDEAERLCDRVAIVDAGRVIAAGKPHDLIREHSSPYVQLVISRDRLDPASAAAVPGVVNAREEGASTIVETDRPEDVLVTLGQRVGFDNIHTRATTLEDVYLRLTGKEYSA